MTSPQFLVLHRSTRIVTFQLVYCIFSANALALPYPSPGVKNGDWIRYTFEEFAEQQYQWERLELLSVTGTKVTLRMVVHYSYGGQTNQTEHVDLASNSDAEVATFTGLIYVVPAGLKPGDIVYSSEFGNITVTGETTRTYAGSSRAVAYSSLMVLGTQYTFYWDKQLGVLLESVTTYQGKTGLMTFRATDTNMWVVAGVDWGLWTIVTVIVVTVAAAVIVLAVRKKISGKMRRKSSASR